MNVQTSKNLEESVMDTSSRLYPKDIEKQKYVLHKFPENKQIFSKMALIFSHKYFSEKFEILTASFKSNPIDLKNAWKIINDEKWSDCEVRNGTSSCLRNLSNNIEIPVDNTNETNERNNKKEKKMIINHEKIMVNWHACLRSGFSPVHAQNLPVDSRLFP